MSDSHRPVLDRLPPPDWRHVSLWPLTVGTFPDEPTPVIMGTTWYEWMFDPVYDPSDRRWWIGRDVQADRWGRPVGGHAYVLPQRGHRDLIGWWEWYDQGVEGKCCGYAGARAMSIVDRKRFDPHRLYYEAQKSDEWPGEAYEGTSVRATVDVLRRDGLAPVRGGKIGATDIRHGIKHNRWGQTVDDIYGCLQWPWLEAQGIFAILNSWGPLRDQGRRGWPHIVYIDAEQMSRLLDEYGESTVFVPA